MATPVLGPDGQPRCSWIAAVPEFLSYHDTEWGFPDADDYRLFEKLSLEAFQSGLSWRTILAKRENFRAAFRGFDFHSVARFTDADVSRLLGDSGIVRHRGKIEAVIGNARRAGELADREGSLAAYIWRYEPEAESMRAAEALSKDLRKQGWKFVGPTTVYAFMEATGLVNNHAEECAIWPEADRQRRGFTRPA
jgi:DNA-3-methyladenine glycosylase I